jgi:hypothetical protein
MYVCTVPVNLMYSQPIAQVPRGSNSSSNTIKNPQNAGHGPKQGRKYIYDRFHPGKGRQKAGFMYRISSMGPRKDISQERECVFLLVAMCEARCVKVCSHMQGWQQIKSSRQHAGFVKPNAKNTGFGKFQPKFDLIY